MIYLDWNATTPPSPGVLAAMAAAAERAWGNPSSLHAAGRAARAEVDRAREALAGALGRDPRDVTFTSGGTEANNLALRGLAPPVDLTLVTSELEHPSIVETARALAAAGAEVVWLPVPESGRLAPESVRDALRGPSRRVRVVTAQAVNHETGVVHPLQEIAAEVRRAGALLVVDAVQALGRIPLGTPAGPLDPPLGDVVTVSSHKIRGPKGVGACVTGPGVRLAPILHGGSQERGVRPGTLDPIVAAGFARALAELDDLRAAFAATEPFRDRLEAGLVELGGLPNGGRPRAPHVTNVSFPRARGDELCAALDLSGVAVSSGAACSAGTSEPSRVVSAMLGTERARGAVRLSLGPGSTSPAIEECIRLIRQALSAGVR